MDLDHIWTMVLLNILSDVECSVCRGIVAFGWPITSNKFLMMTPYFALRYRAANSASALDDITLQTMVDTMCTNPLFIIGWTFFELFC